MDSKSTNCYTLRSQARINFSKSEKETQFIPKLIHFHQILRNEMKNIGKIEWIDAKTAMNAHFSFLYPGQPFQSTSKSNPSQIYSHHFSTDLS